MEYIKRKSIWTDKDFPKIRNQNRNLEFTNDNIDYSKLNINPYLFNNFYDDFG